jgi:hypothetical protein
MLQVAQGQRDSQLKIAQVQKIKDEVTTAQQKLIQDYNLDLVTIFTTKVAAEKLAKAAQSKDLRERMVAPITVKNGEGEETTIEGFPAATKEEGIEIREIRKLTKVINNRIDEIEALYLNESNWLPASIDKSTASLNQYYNDLKTIVKELKGMGANFTVPEIEMIDATIPTNSVADKLNSGLVKIRNLRDIYISDQYAMMESYGYTKMPNAANKKKLAKGMQAGVSN